MTTQENPMSNSEQRRKEELLVRKKERGRIITSKEILSKQSQYMMSFIELLWNGGLILKQWQK